MLMLLPSCFNSGRIPEVNAFCAGLEAPVDELADTVLEHREETPGEVILSATTVVVAYDGGCNGS